MAASNWRLFERYGVELEYMIVDADSLDVRPIADRLLEEASGDLSGDFVSGEITWSNELVAHVVELKCTEPAKDLAGLPEVFMREVRAINGRLAPLGAQLLPTAMHPWMDPARETKLWPHDNGEVYAAFDRVFSCQGHGWSNLQSTHVNLPFSGDEEFGRLHAAIRLLLPLLPALAASSPLADGRVTGLLDTRLEMYRNNSRRIPSVAAQVIPEPVYTEADYRRTILDRMYADIAPHDPAGALQDEFLNARGAIARFSRGAIEIRLLDVQESPAADVAVVALVVGVLKLLVAERWSSAAEQMAFLNLPLEQLFLAAIRAGEQATIDEAGYLRQFGITDQSRASAGDVWRHLFEAVRKDADAEQLQLLAPLDVYRREGTLATRMLRALPKQPDAAALRDLMHKLAACLAENRPFSAQ